jgi:hypothetical protein
MKKLILIAALGLGLAACDNAAEESDDPVTEETAAAAEEGMAGTYEFELDGVPTTAVLMADGMYTDSQDGQVTESGMWAERDDGKVCFDPEGDDTLETCFTIGETGSVGTFVATPDEGEPLTIRKVS